MPPSRLLLLATGLSSLCLAAPGIAAAAGEGSPGTIVITEKRMNPAMADFKAELKAEARTSLAKSPDSDAWHVNFIAYLSKAPGASDVNLVFYETPQPGAKTQGPRPAGPPEPVSAFPIKTNATAKAVMAEIDLRTENGFKPGRKYQVFVTRLINGKEERYARTTLELKDAAGATGGAAAPSRPAKPGASTSPGDTGETGGSAPE